MQFDHLIKLVDIPEPLKYHPEGNTYDHTLLVAMKAKYLTPSKSVMAAAILHDICKAKEYRHDFYDIRTNTIIQNTSYDHPKQAFNLIDGDDDLRYWIHSIGANIDIVLSLVLRHMAIKTHIPKKDRLIPFIDQFRVCDDMINRHEFNSNVWGYNGDFKYSRISFAGLSPIDIRGGAKNYTVTINRMPRIKPVAELHKELPKFVTDAFILR